MVSARVKWLRHKGKDILFSDYKDATEQECFDIMEEAHHEVTKHVGEQVLMLVGQVTVPMTKDFTAVMKKYRDQTAAKNIEVINCLVGSTKTKSVISKLIDTTTHTVDTIEEGMDWLVEQSKK